MVRSARRFARLAASLLVCVAAGLAMAMAPATVDWPNHGGPVDESGFADLSQINRANVGKLGLAWYLDLPGEASLEATPLAVNGVLYFTGSYSAVYAVDAVSGRLLWKYDPQMWKRSPERFRIMFSANRGVAYADGRVFVAALDGHLTALDAKSGRVLWDVQTLPEHTLYYSTGAPRVFKGKVVIGNAGNDAGMRGYVTAYDAATGEQRWRFYVAPGSPQENAGDPTMQMAAKTWTGEYWKTGTGGGPWNGITFDPELNRVYIGTGNSGPYDPRVRSPGGGDNLFLVSIVALDADTGKYVWHYQMNPREAWDFKATANMIAATLTIDGRPRKVLMQAPTNGFFYVLDRETGKLISAEKLGKVTWAERVDLATGRPVEAPNIRYETGETIIWPGPAGAHNWQAMSFDPRTGLVYLPYLQLGGRYSTRPAPGELALGGMVVSGYRVTPDDGWAALLAWDPVRKAPRWQARLSTLFNGGVLSTTGDLVFQGTADGYFTAYDGQSGQRLWRFSAGLGIIAAPISYAVNGQQYVSVLVGYGGGAGAGGMNVGWKYGAQPRRLLTFRLDGKASLPPSPPPDYKVYALDDPSLSLDPKQVEAGREVSAYCIVCHGAGLRGSGAPGPDLRESRLALSQEGLWAVVHDGALQSRGMPKFDMLTRDQVNALHAYIRAQAREALSRPGSAAAAVPAPGSFPAAHF
jgi:quinohemoprotein ethanol dehydrogenase